MHWVSKHCGKHPYSPQLYSRLKNSKPQLYLFLEFESGPSTFIFKLSNVLLTLKLNPHTLTAFFQSIVSWPVGRVANKSVGRFSHGHETRCQKRGQVLKTGGEIISCRESSTVEAPFFCTPPSLTLCVIHEEKCKNGAVHATARAMLDLRTCLKLNFYIMLQKEHGQSFPYIFQNFQVQ